MSIDEAFDVFLDRPELREKAGLNPGHWRVLRSINKTDPGKVKMDKKAKLLKLAGFTEISYWTAPVEKEQPAVETEG